MNYHHVQPGKLVTIKHTSPLWNTASDDIPTETIGKHNRYSLGRVSPGEPLLIVEFKHHYFAKVLTTSGLSGFVHWCDLDPL